MKYCMTCGGYVELRLHKCNSILMQLTNLCVINFDAYRKRLLANANGSVYYRIFVHPGLGTFNCGDHQYYVLAMMFKRVYNIKPAEYGNMQTWVICYKKGMSKTDYNMYYHPDGYTCFNINKKVLQSIAAPDDYELIMKYANGYATG